MRLRELATTAVLMFTMTSAAQTRPEGWSIYQHPDLGVRFSFPSGWVSIPPPDEAAKKASEAALKKLLGGQTEEVLQVIEEFGIQTVEKLVKPQRKDGPRIPTSLSVMLMPSASPLWNSDHEALQRELASDALEIYTDGKMEANYMTVSSSGDYIAYRLTGKIQSVPIHQEFIFFRPRDNLTCAIVITYENLKDRPEVTAIVKSLQLGSSEKENRSAPSKTVDQASIRNALRGHWRVTAMWEHGKKVNLTGKTTVLRFGEGTFAYVEDGEVVANGTYVSPSSENSSHIDFQIGSGPDTHIIPGLYRVDGKTLKMNQMPGGGSRPTQVGTTPDGHYLEATLAAVVPAPPIKIKGK